MKTELQPSKVKIIYINCSMKPPGTPLHSDKKWDESNMFYAWKRNKNIVKGSRARKKRRWKKGEKEVN